MKKDTTSTGSVISEVSSYIAKSGDAHLPVDVIKKTKHHILDTLSAIVSGSGLKPGRLARKFVQSQAGAEEAQVIATPFVTTAINAAFANAMMAHSDETDDSHSKSLTHPGCVMVPAALAMSERQGADGMSFLRGVVAGYDIGCRITQALWTDDLHQTSYATFGVGGNFGAAAAAASVLGLQETPVRYVLSYAVQQVSGIRSLFREREHIEKAFVFAGMPARNGVTAAVLVQSGFTGVADPFSGEHNFFEVFSHSSKPELLVDGLGKRYEIMSTNIKKFPVGFPIQAALEALLLLLGKHKFAPKDVQSITAKLPTRSVRTVDSRNMPDINLQHILAVALLDGGITFATAHSHERMNDPAVLEVKKRISLVGDPVLSAARGAPQAIVEVTTTDGTQFKEHVASVRGRFDNPMTTEELEKKCLGLLAPVLGADRSQKLIDRVWNLEQVNNVRELRPLLSAP